MFLYVSPGDLVPWGSESRLLDDLPFLDPCSRVISRPSLVLFYSGLLPRNDNTFQEVLFIGVDPGPLNPRLFIILCLGRWWLLCWMLHPSEYNLVLVVGQVTFGILKGFIEHLD